MCAVIVARPTASWKEQNLRGYTEPSYKRRFIGPMWADASQLLHGQ